MGKVKEYYDWDDLLVLPIEDESPESIFESYMYEQAEDYCHRAAQRRPLMDAESYEFGGPERVVSMLLQLKDFYARIQN